MALWLVFSTTAAALCTAVVWLAAAGARPRPEHDGSERAAWWRLSWPVVAGALVFAFLAGWALREPDPADEQVELGLCAFALIAVTVLARALLRADRARRAARRAWAPIATVGLFRCRTMVSDAFRRSAAPEVLAAALAHEAAHARGRDPARIWIAQLIADLQWPIPGARQRLRRWALALELRRDDEALAAGASPPALAESIVLAARLRCASRGRLQAAMTGAGDGLALRVRRLLALSPGYGSRARRRLHGFWTGLCCVAGIAAAGWLGVVFGDAVLGWLPGIQR